MKIALLLIQLREKAATDEIATRDLNIETFVQKEMIWQVKKLGDTLNECHHTTSSMIKV